jgi:A/G-specific adenine glycosylase
MTEVPGSDWLVAHDETIARAQAPAVKGLARWHRKTGTVTHVFTHFPLELSVYVGKVASRTKAPHGMRWVKIATLKDEALPNVMRKVIAHGLGEK